MVDPHPFNPDYRPGFGEELAKRYDTHCEKHPQASRSQLAAAHKDIAAEIRPLFPRWAET